LVAGLLILTAVTWRGKDSTSWRIELVGLAPGIAAWLSYGLTSFSTGSPFFTTLGLAFALGGLLRIRATARAWRRYASVTEQEPRRAEGLPGDGRADTLDRHPSHPRIGDHQLARPVAHLPPQALRRHRPPHGRVHVAGDAGQQIGRASCRERVEISADAGR